MCPRSQIVAFGSLHTKSYRKKKSNFQLAITDKKNDWWSKIESPKFWTHVFMTHFISLHYFPIWELGHQKGGSKYSQSKQKSSQLKRADAIEPGKEEYKIAEKKWFLIESGRGSGSSYMFPCLGTGFRSAKRGTIRYEGISKRPLQTKITKMSRSGLVRFV